MLTQEEFTAHFNEIKQTLLKNRRIYINIETDLPTLFILIAQIQLALRHPGNTGPAALETRQLAERLINMIRQDFPAVAEVLDIGWEPTLDIPAP